MKNYCFVSSFLILLSILFFLSFEYCYSVSPQNEVVVSSHLNKYKFIPGESLIISGKANVATIKNNSISLKPYEGLLNVKIFKLPNNLTSNYSVSDVQKQGTLLHTKFLPTATNGSIDDFILESPDIGKYIILYNPYKGNVNQTISRDVFEVVSPVNIIWASPLLLQ